MITAILTNIDVSVCGEKKSLIFDVNDVADDNFDLPLDNFL